MNGDTDRDDRAFRAFFEALWLQDDSYGRYIHVMHQAWNAALAWERERTPEPAAR